MARVSRRDRGDPRGVRVAVIAGLAALGAIVYAPRVADGGFAWDDWEKAAEAMFWFGPGLLGPIDVREAIYQPGLALLLPLPHIAFGEHTSPQLGLAVALGVAMSFCVYILLRELGVPAAISAAISALSLLFPWSDSVRLWATGGANQVSVSLLLIGAALALRGLAQPPSRASPWRRWSLVAYVASMLSYPVTPVLVGASTLLYRVRAPWQRAWAWGRQDLIAALAVGVYLALTTTKPVQSLGDQLDHAGTMLEGWVTLLPHAVFPFGHAPRGIAWAGAAGIVLAGWVALRRESAGAAPNERLRLGLALVGVGLAASLLAYVVFVPGEAKYYPLAPGIYNRAGILAGPAVAAVVVGLALTAVALAMGRRAPPLATQVPTICLVIAVGVGWTGLVRDDIALWRRAATESERVLAALDDRRLAIPNEAVVLTVGHPHTVAPGVPVFGASFDLNAAFKLRRGSEAPRAYPLDVPYACEPRALAPIHSQIRDLPSPGYGSLWIVDVEQRRAWRIRSADACRRTRASVVERIALESVVSALEPFSPGP